MLRGMNEVENQQCEVSRTTFDTESKDLAIRLLPDPKTLIFEVISLNVRIPGLGTENPANLIMHIFLQKDTIPSNVPGSQ